jgi:hypothetical protein
MKMGDLVKINDSWNSGNPPVIGIFIDPESLEDKQSRESNPRIKVLLPSGKFM